MMLGKMFGKRNCVSTYLLLILITAMPTLALAIDSPRDVRGTEVGQSVVKWEWSAVPGAASYEVRVDGNAAGNTRSPQLFSRNLWVGEHSMSVQAIGLDGSYSGSSYTVKINVRQNYDANGASRSFAVGQNRAVSSAVASSAATSRAAGSGPIPQNPRGSEISGGSVQWEWDAVEGATGYDVTVDGSYVATTGETNYTSNNLWIGEHSMTVMSVNASGSKSAQSNTVKLNVNGRADAPVTADGSAPPPAAPPPVQAQADPNAARVESLIDPASFNFPEVGQKDGYELVFSDEFNGNAINPFRWHTQLRWDGEFNGERFEYRVINGEDQFYVNPLSADSAHREQIVPAYNPFQFNGSTMSIRATKNPLKRSNDKRTFGSLSQISQQQNFLSGAISTHEKFAQKYGYFEARIKIPSHEGTFPAFWLFHERRANENTQRTEIDIMENLGHAPWYVYNSFHYFKNVSATYGGDANFIKPRPSGQIYDGTDFSQNFHVYAVDWSPGKIVWYIDGQQVSVLENGEVNFEELYVMLNLAMGGNWTNFPANAGGLGRPSNERYPTQNDLNNFRNPALEIDYVRVYKRR